MLELFSFDAVITEKGYDSDPQREQGTARQVEAVIPSRRYRKQPHDCERLHYSERNVVERFIHRFKWFRRVFTRNEKLARRFMAFLHIAATLKWLELNVNEPLPRLPTFHASERVRLPARSAAAAINKSRVDYE